MRIPNPNTKNEILEELTLFRNEYFNKVQSWGRSDADKWWETQVASNLQEVERASRENTFEIVHQAWLEETRKTNVWGKMVLNFGARLAQLKGENK